MAAYAREVHPNIMFGVPRIWEKLHAGVAGAMAADPGTAAQFEAAVEAAKPISLKMAWGEATDAEKATWHALDEGAFAPVRKSARARPARHRHQRRRADPAGSARLVSGHRRADVGDLRHVGGLWSDDLDAAPDQAGHGRAGDPRL